MKRFLLLPCCILLLSAAYAIDSEPPFADPAVQARYEQLIHQIRCLVCQDESIADSTADLAADFRRQIHTMLAAGMTDQQIKQYMVNRYGDFVLYKPPVQANTWLLWGGPFLLLLIAVSVLLKVVRRRAHMENTEPRNP